MMIDRTNNSRVIGLLGAPPQRPLYILWMTLATSPNLWLELSQQIRSPVSYTDPRDLLTFEWVVQCRRCLPDLSQRPRQRKRRRRWHTHSAQSAPLPRYQPRSAGAMDWKGGVYSSNPRVQLFNLSMVLGPVQTRRKKTKGMINEGKEKGPTRRKKMPLLTAPPCV